MEAMDEDFSNLEKSAEDTSRRLDTLKLDMRKAMDQATIIEERIAVQQQIADEFRQRRQIQEEQRRGQREGAQVDDMLQHITRVMEDYQHLQNDIAEIQQLQKELSAGLRRQLTQVHAGYLFLRNKLGPALPEDLLMHKHCHDSRASRRANGNTPYERR